MEAASHYFNHMLLTANFCISHIPAGGFPRLCFSYFVHVLYSTDSRGARTLSRSACAWVITDVEAGVQGSVQLLDN